MGDLNAGEISGECLDPRIGQQPHLAAMPNQFRSKRLGRKQMAAGSAGSEDERPAHRALPASRRRVNASIIPIPMPRASIEEPP